MKLKSSIGLICIGLFTGMAWVSGSHGHLQFRRYMVEDWVIGGILSVCFGLPLLFLAIWIAGQIGQRKKMF